MRREYATFQSLAHFFNYVAVDGEKKIVFVCSSRGAFAEEVSRLADSPHQPTLNQLATAGRVVLYFVPTIAHLCAALSIREGFKAPKNGAPEISTLVILNIMSFSSTGGSQRLSQMIALAVDATETAGVNLLLAQNSSQNHQHLEEDNRSVASVGWHERLSILGSRSTLPSTRQPWAARTVTPEQVISRWCKCVEPGNSTSLFRV